MKDYQLLSKAQMQGEQKYFIFHFTPYLASDGATTRYCCLCGVLFAHYKRHECKENLQGVEFNTFVGIILEVDM
jgi:hypothetical protein